MKRDWLCRFGVHRWAFWPKASTLGLSPNVHIYVVRTCLRQHCEAQRYDS